MNNNVSVLALLMMAPGKLERSFDLIPLGERKVRIDVVNKALGEMKEEVPDPNGLLRALLDEEFAKTLTQYPEFYECVYQMPFSKYSFILKMTKDNTISYSLDREVWEVWKGEGDNYTHFLKGKFKLDGPFYNEMARSFITRTVTQFHDAGLWYFKNLAIGRK